MTAVQRLAKTLNKQDYLEYYKTHSRKETCEHFKIAEWQHKSLMAFWKVSKSDVNALRMPELDIDEVWEYYISTESFTSTCEKFNLTRAQFINLFGENALPRQLFATKFETFINNHTKEELEEYYRTHSLPELFEKYNLSNGMLHDILNFWGIAPKTRDEIRQINKRIYGVEETFQVKEFQEKAKQTNLARYGYEVCSKADSCKAKAKQTCLELYGVPYTGQAEIVRKKMKQTNLEKYGVENWMCSDSPKLKKKRLAIRNAPGVQAKITATKRINNTFNTSEKENIFYGELLKIFPETDIFREFECDRYPYRCDFYIKSLDTFIELNLFFTHGPHPFDLNNSADQQLLQLWQQRAIEKPLYKNAIETWTQRDVLKYKTAKDNKLNYILVYNIKEFEDTLQKLRRMNNNDN